MINHLACIMDGNRRWAKKQGKLSILGHKEGVNAAYRVLDFCLKNKISYVSLYTFSLENFNRSEQEKSYLFDLIIKASTKHLDDLIKKDIKIKFVGDRSQFPESVISACNEIEQKTAHCESLQCNLLFCYGARQEIVAAVQTAIAQKIDVNDQNFKQLLWTGDMPDPDVIIRTGGVRRLSNFLLYQSAYTEIRFTDTLWPDMQEDELFSLVSDSVGAQKNYGH